MVDVLIASYPQIGFCCKLYRMNYFNHLPKYNWQGSTFKMNSEGRISKQQFREWRVLLGTSTEIRFWMKTPRLWNFDNKTFSLNQRTLTTWSLQKMQENIKPNLVQVSLKTILIPDLWALQLPVETASFLTKYLTLVWIGECILLSGFINTIGYCIQEILFKEKGN